jgi:ADP-ribose pyrophosphatase
MGNRWECLESNKVFEDTDEKGTTYMEVYQDKVRTLGGKVITYTRYYASDVVVVVPFLDNDRLIMIRQYRYPVGKVLLEFPAGHVESGEEPAETARRELEEETGYSAGKIEYAYSYYQSVSRSKQSALIFLASGLVQKGGIKHDSGEEIDVEILTARELRKLIAERKVENAATLVAYLLCCGTEIKLSL